MFGDDLKEALEVELEHNLGMRKTMSPKRDQDSLVVKIGLDTDPYFNNNSTKST